MSVVKRVVVGDIPLVAKSATGGDRRRLRREAELLGHLDGLPVVAHVALRESDDRTDLVTRDAGDHDLSSPGGLRPGSVLGALAGTADAVGRLHAAGWTHGAICCEHVVVDHRGQVTLCSLSSARPTAASDDAVDLDLDQLRALVVRVLGSGDPGWSTDETRRWRRRTRRLRRRLERCDPAGSPQQRLSAAQLSSILREPPPGRRHPIPARAPTTEDDRTEHRVRSGLTGATLGLLAGAVGLGLSALLWGAVSTAGAGDARTRGDALEGPCPDPAAPVLADVDGDGCPEPVELEGNQLRTGATTLRAGHDGDQVVVAPLDCDRAADHQVVLLRPSTGEVFGFDEWPTPGRPATALLLGTAPGATELDTAVRGDCRTATPRRSDGASVAIIAADAAASDSEAGAPLAQLPSTKDDRP